MLIIIFIVVFLTLLCWFVRIKIQLAEIIISDQVREQTPFILKAPNWVSEQISVGIIELVCPGATTAATIVAVKKFHFLKMKKNFAIVAMLATLAAGAFFYLK